MRCATPNATPVATMSFKKGCHIFKSEKFNGDAPNPHIVLKGHVRPFLYRFRFVLFGKLGVLFWGSVTEILHV